MEKLKVFYDGACHLCHREIKHYEKLDKKNLLDLVDISQSQFDPNDFGLDFEEININMHSINDTGEVFVGVDTFIEIWRRVAPYHLLIPVVDSKILRPVFNTFYRVFAENIRPKLPKRQCEDGTCSLS